MLAPISNIGPTDPIILKFLRLSSGSRRPEVIWNGANSQLKFQMDLGSRVASDFWVIRAVWQKKAPNAQFANGKSGLIPVLSEKWLTSHGYVVDNSGLVGGTGGGFEDKDNWL